MLPTPMNYTIWPSVVPADQAVEMVIVPTARAFLMPEEALYEITVIDVSVDNNYYHGKDYHKKWTAYAHDGVLRFSCTFAGEMQHTVILSRDGKTIQNFEIYALREDLYRLRPFKGDLHVHSYRSDGLHDPAEFFGIYREQGYDFMALTDHNRFYPGGEIDETYAGISVGCCRIRGEEIHAPGSPLHIVHVGGKTSVAELYLKDYEGFLCDVENCLKEVPAEVPAQYHERYAKAKWVTDKIHEAGGIAVFPHPFWKPGCGMYNISEEFARILLNSGMFDVFEILGTLANKGTTANLTTAFWQDMRAEGLRIPVVGSSDCHTVKDESFITNFTICFAEENTNHSLIEAVQNGMTIAVRGVPLAEHDQFEYHCYGSFRLVLYAQFLLENYFPRRQRICQCEGVFMRQYAVGEADGALLSAAAQQSRDFTERFFGRKPPALPTLDMLAFEDKWRDIQLCGPVTKGSAPFSKNVNRQI